MIALDSSVIVAALTSWHRKREAAAAAVEKALGSRSGVIIPIHALLEAYSVMTRIPALFRLLPAEAWELLSRNFAHVRLAMLPASAIWPLLAALSSADLGGGSMYDAAILAAAESAGASALLTFNVRHFERLRPHIRIEEP